MNTDVEELLREGMERFTRDLRAPARLTRQVARRRRRRLALCSVTVAAAALTAGGVALAAVVMPAADNGSLRPIVDTAYVVKRVSTALSAAEPGEIAQVKVTRSVAIRGGTAATTTAEEWSYGDQWRSVTSSPAGRPVYDEGFSASGVYTVVSYGTHTWARKHGLGRPAAPVFGGLGLGPLAGNVIGRSGLGPLAAIFFSRSARRSRPAQVFVSRRCNLVVAAAPLLFQPGLPGFGFSASSLPAARALRNAISCGTLAVAGRQRIDGSQAIELTSRRNSLISETIWVRPGTYLPVRMVVRSAPGMPEALQQTANITWLPPTAQNLAKLTVPIPAGFRRVRVMPLALALLPILQQYLAGSAAKPGVLCPGPRQCGWS
jgi:hypothetical protein